MSFFGLLKMDLRANKGSVRGMVIVTLYRVANTCSKNRRKNLLTYLFCSAYLIFYRIATEFFLGCEIQAGAQIGGGLIIDHGFAIVINKNCKIGAQCRLRHGVTLGCNVNKDGTQGPSPTIGDRVEFGAYACVVGDVKIGNSVRVGANSLVTTDLPDNSTALGVPATVVKIREI